MKESTKVLLEAQLRNHKDVCRAIKFLLNSANMFDPELTDISEEKLAEMGAYLRLKE